MLKKTRRYSRKSTEREVYERECFYKIIVEDKSGIVDTEDDKFLDKMFEAFKDYKLNSYCCNKIDPRKYNVKITISNLGSDKIAKVGITKRTIFQRITAVFRSL